MYQMPKRFATTVLAVVLTLLVAAPGVGASESELVIMATTDIHANIYPWDYYGNKVDDTVGLAKIYTLVQQIRRENPNTLLFDDGDLIQGTPLGYYEAIIDPPKGDEVHPIIQVMNRMDYDAGIYGNHEFNYTLPFAERTFADAGYPMLSANIYKPGTDAPYFTPYVILDREVDGVPIRVGVIGFTPPQIMTWDRTNLEGRVETGDIVDAAKRYVPQMLAEGADIIVALAHSGADPVAAQSWHPGSGLENASFALAMHVPDIDVLVVGHSHIQIPGPGLPQYPDGIVNGVALIQANFWGKALGVVELGLGRTDGEWQVLSKKSKLISTEGVAPSADVLEWARAAHEETVAYVTSPIGETTEPISSRASRLTDTGVVQLINDVQAAFTEEALQSTQYKDLPVLSVAAPYKGGRGGPSDFTDIPAGGVTIGDVASIYLYDNTVKVLKVTGADVKAWLEWSAQNFRQVTPGSGEKPMIDLEWRPYNYDQIDGVQYKIDITKPLGKRVVGLTFDGEPIDPDQEFALVGNNYRADGGGGFPATGAEGEIILDPLVENRQLIIDYIQSEGTISPVPDHNWSLVRNYLDHPQAQYAYDLVHRGVLLGGLEGALKLDDPLTGEAWAGMLSRAFGVEWQASDPQGEVSSVEAVSSLQGTIRLAGGTASQAPLTRGDAAQLLSGALALSEVLTAL